MKVNINQISEKEPDLKSGKKSFNKTKKPAGQKVRKEKFKKDSKPADNLKNRKQDVQEHTADGKFDYVAALKEQMNKLKWREMLQNNKFWFGVIAVLLIVFLSVNSNMSNSKTQLTIQIKRINAETEILNTAISDVMADLEEQARIEANKLSEEQEELAKNNAIKQGEHVATLQNAYRYILDINDNAFKNNKESLDVCFGENDKAARSEWYPYSIDGIPGTWEFVSEAPFVGNIAKVLWLCYDDDHNMLLAYCVATYDADTQLFTNVGPKGDLKLTKYAFANIKIQEEDTKEGEQGQSILDKFNPEQSDKYKDQLSSMLENGDIETNNDQIDKEALGEVNDVRDDFKNDMFNGNIEGEEVDPGYKPGLGDYDEVMGAASSDK